MGIKMVVKSFVTWLDKYGLLFPVFLVLYAAMMSVAFIVFLILFGGR